MPVEHRLNSRDPRVWRRYCNQVSTCYEQNHIPTKLIQLQAMRQNYLANPTGDIQPIISLHHDIHKLTRRIRQETAKKIRKVRRGEVPWSPRLQRFRDEIEL